MRQVSRWQRDRCQLLAWRVFLCKHIRQSDTVFHLPCPLPLSGLALKLQGKDLARGTEELPQAKELVKELHIYMLGTLGPHFVPGTGRILLSR